MTVPSLILMSSNILHFRLPYLTVTLKPDLIFFQAGVDPHKGNVNIFILMDGEGIENEGS